MLRTSESETEILLGNKQLLGIFFVVAILLGVAFYSGYMVGKGGAHKTPPAAPPPAADSTSTSLAIPATGGETHSVPADSGTPPDSTARTSTDTGSANEPAPLGSPKRKNAPPQPSPDLTASAADTGTFAPRSGQTFLQVTAVGHDEAIAIADVLQKKGFRAHAVPKPGSSKLYRVLVGPVRDTADLSSTRDSLRRTGFREVIVQRY
jgi:cell division septation protein DedD